MNTIMFIFVVAISLYVGAKYHKEVMDFIKKANDFSDRYITKTSKKKRKASLKKKYGFDDSYDKYIA